MRILATLLKLAISLPFALLAVLALVIAVQTNEFTLELLTVRTVLVTILLVVAAMPWAKSEAHVSEKRKRTWMVVLSLFMGFGALILAYQIAIGDIPAVQDCSKEIRWYLQCVFNNWLAGVAGSVGVAVFLGGIGLLMMALGATIGFRKKHYARYTLFRDPGILQKQKAPILHALPKIIKP